MIRIPRLVGAASAIVSLAFVFAVVLVPVLALLRAGMGAEPRILDRAVLAVARATLVQAGVSTVLSVALGLPLGWAASRFWHGRVGDRLRALLLFPYGVPSVVAAVAWIRWLGGSGLGIAYSFSAVIIAHVFFNAPWVALLVADSAATVPRREREALRTLGGSRLDELRTLLWPAIRLPLASAASQTLALCAMSFGLVMILGGGPPVQTLETALYSRIRYGSLDVGGATACAIWELAIAGIPWLVALAFASSARRRRRPDRSGPEEGGPAVAGFAIFAACLLLIAPYFSVFSGWSWHAVATAQVRAALVTSLEISALSGLVSLAVAGAAVAATEYLRLPALSVAFLAPSGISALVLGLGAWIAFGEWVDPFEGSLVWIVMIQSAILVPVAFRIFWALARSTRRELVEAAVVLGASPARAFYLVEGRRWKKALASALALAMAAALSEFSAVSLFFSEKIVPLSLLISRLQSRYRFEEAESVAALLLLLAAGIVVMVPLLGGSNADLKPSR